MTPDRSDCITALCVNDLPVLTDEPATSQDGWRP